LRRLPVTPPRPGEHVRILADLDAGGAVFGLRHSGGDQRALHPVLVLGERVKLGHDSSSAPCLRGLVPAPPKDDFDVEIGVSPSLLPLSESRRLAVLMAFLAFRRFRDLRANPGAPVIVRVEPDGVIVMFETAASV
jgi:hypothetical protein